LESRDVIGHVTIRFPDVDFLWVVHGDHTSIWWHRYGDMAFQMLDARTLARKERRKKGKKKVGGKGKGKGKVEVEKDLPAPQAWKAELIW